MRRARRGMALASLLAMGVAGCTAGSDPTPVRSTTTLVTPTPTEVLADTGQAVTMAVITHGDVADPFWGVVRSGAEDAAAVYGVVVEYQSDTDPAGQARLVDAALAADVDGLVISLPDPEVLREPLTRAAAAGVPIVTINAGGAESNSFGALTHVGQSDLDAGRGAGQRLREAGVNSLVCVIQDSGDPNGDQRCQGAAEGFGGDETAVANLTVNGGAPAVAETTIETYLRTNPGVDGILTLDATLAAAAWTAVAETGVSATVATFELDPAVRQAIRDGEVLFAVDQQEYLQGYLPVVALAVYLRTGTIVGAGQIVPTGPRYVTADNVDTVGNLSVAGPD